jgi:hypothetical protein
MSSAEMPVASPEGDVVDRLIAELRARGITFLTGGDDPALAEEVARAPLPPAMLLRALAACPEPSVRDATIALLLLHPALAEHLPPEDLSTDDTTEQLITLALAAVYLQRMWRTRLTFALGKAPWLPARYWSMRGLPDPTGAPDGANGELGLRALAVRERQHSHRPFHYLSMWQQQVDHLVAQDWRGSKRKRSLRRGHRGCDAAAAAIPPAPNQPWGALGMPHAPRGGIPMSMRAPANRERIEHFLERLGRQVQTPGRLYLVGGTTMVYEGFRATTVDVDVLVEADDPGPLMSAIRALKDELDINIEFASPRDFIPLPSGWRERSVFIGRFGPLEVFHFDHYSMALSKIERGTERDFQDVVALVQNGRLDLADLDVQFEEILPRIATEGLGAMDPDVFEEHYRYLRGLLGNTTST